MLMGMVPSLLLLEVKLAIETEIRKQLGIFSK